ncbi:DEAD/DEAH box helicase [Streptomyces sp. SP17BM10]|uniref:DEAD/DEAH box helicase n=1 Tax=Streptomyces sp. SP17BM10 TaxID=3002530 RepID=UPI002E773640|nr:DEAD/DEAH box helicase [Streptomyces sp. SP17BM10]MEE1784884.1 DEAD/DEAH box helicase [Streptomyces sp. SP17BM10]
MTLPVALTGHDVIGQAKTGTGKTLGFGLPLIERAIVRADVDAGRATEDQLSNFPQALIVVPTRELCTQVTNDLQTAGKVRNVRVLAVYGGRAYEPQVEALTKGVDIVVGTPGRLLDLAGQKKLNLSKVRALVLDEADEMLDLGFLPDVEKIITMLPAKRQTLLFSATMPGQVINLARRYMSQPTHIRATAPDDTGSTVANTEQHIFRAHSLDKVEMVSRILQADGRGLAMIFCRTKRTAADVSDQLTQRGFAAGAVHGDLGQGAREQALRAFRNGKVDVLVCTDVAARGIDVEGVTHVINYQCPEDEKTYLHRIGRTGRAGASGTAVTLVDWDDIPRWQLINKALDLPFNEPEETYSTSPHLYELLKIAPGIKGILPRSERTRAGLGAEEVEDLGETGGRGARSGRGGRSERGGSGGSGGSGRPGGPTVEAAEEKPRRTRERRRTRRGSAVGEGEAAAAVTGAPSAATAPAVEGTEGEAAPRRRRRRSRGGASGAEAAVVEAAVVEAAEAVVAEAVAVTEAPAQEKPVARTRTRTRKPKAETVAEAVVEAAEAVVAEAVAETVTEAPAEERKPATRTRTRKPKAEAAAEAAVTEAPAEEKPAARTRTRKPKTEAVVAETVAETVTEAPAEEKKPATRTRTRKPKAEVAAEAAVTEAPAEEKPATRTRTRKPKTEAVVAETVADAPAAETAEVPAPRRRTRTRKAAEATPES